MDENDLARALEGDDDDGDGESDLTNDDTRDLRNESDLDDGGQDLDENDDGSDNDEGDEEGDDDPKRKPEDDESDAEPEGRYKVVVKDLNGALVEHKVSFADLKSGYQRGLDADRIQQQSEVTISQLRDAVHREVAQARDSSSRMIGELEALVMQALNVVTPDQLMSLAHSDREQYQEAVLRQQMLTQVRDRLGAARADELRHAQEAQQRDQMQRTAQVRDRSLAALSAAGITSAQVQELYDRNGAAYGYSPEELATNIDHRLVLLLKDAAAMRKLREANPKVARKVRQAPVLAPTSTRNARVSDQVMKRLRTKGASQEDLAALFERL